MPVTLPLIAPAIWNVAVVIPIVRRFRPVVLLVLIRLVHRYQENGSDQLDIQGALLINAEVICKVQSAKLLRIERGEVPVVVVVTRPLSEDLASVNVQELRRQITSR